MSDSEDSRYALEMNCYFMQLLGIWPLEKDASMVSRLMQKIAVLFGFSLLTFIILPCILNALLEEPDMAIKIKLAGPMIYHLTALLKYVCLVNSVHRMSECFRHIDDDWKYYIDRKATKELSIMRANAKLGRFLTLLCAVFMYAGASFYDAIMPFASQRLATAAALERFADLQKLNLTDLDFQLPHLLPFPVYTKWMSVDKSPSYEIIAVVQWLSGYVSCTITSATFGLTAGSIVHICAQLQIVMHLLDDYVRGDDGGSNYKMKEIVQRHFRVLSFALKIEKLLTAICFIEFLGSTLDICLLGYFILVEWLKQDEIALMTYISLLMSFLFNIFIYCYIGQILTEQCRKVGEKSYDISWYDLPSKKAIGLTMIMIVSNDYPAKITAGQMFDLNMATFSAVIRTAATYMNMLRAFML